jgi:hypothetical protein
MEGQPRYTFPKKHLIFLFCRELGSGGADFAPFYV